MKKLMILVYVMTCAGTLNGMEQQPTYETLPKELKQSIAIDF